MVQVPTQHNRAAQGQIAPVVIMPGDPMRAQFIAQNYLKDAALVNDLRCCYAYTGTYRGQPLTVMAHGMGMPSAGIYTHELFSFYQVERIVRIGTAGALCPEIQLGDLVLAQGACYNSGYAAQFGLEGVYSAIGDFSLLCALEQQARQDGLCCHVGNVFSSDVYYHACPERDLAWAALHVLAVEMETAALYIEAARCKKQAAALLTITANLCCDTAMDPLRSQTVYDAMIQTALRGICHA